MTSRRTPSDEVRNASYGRVFRDALILTVIGSALGVTVNQLRSGGLELVAEQDYDILVPCPVTTGTAEALDAGDPRILAAQALLIDARDEAGYEQWHLSGAMSVPFDWLAEQDEVELQARKLANEVAATGKREVIVYGDGGDPDSGKHWALLLSASGIKNVAYVIGGAEALRASTQDEVGP